MNRKSIAQEYYILVTDKYGMMPAMYREEAGLAKEEKGGLFRPKQVYIPEKKYKEELIGTLKAVIAEEEEMTSQDMALLCILKESRNLNPFFSKDEKHRLRKRINELRQNPGNKKLAEMIGYITYMEDMAMYVFLAGIVSN